MCSCMSSDYVLEPRKGLKYIFKTELSESLYVYEPAEFIVQYSDIGPIA